MVKFSKYESRGQTKWQYYGHAGVDPKTGDKIKLRKKGFSSKAEAKLHYERALDRVRSCMPYSSIFTATQASQSQLLSSIDSTPKGTSCLIWVSITSML